MHALSQLARALPVFCLCAGLSIWAGFTVLSILAFGQAPGSIVTIGPSAEILPPTSAYAFPDGQAYVYGVEWHLFNAGTTTVKLESSGPDQKVSAIADSAGVANVLYGVHDRFEAHFDPKTFCSIGLTKHSEEGPHKRDTRVTFDYPKRKSRLQEKNLKTGETKQAENDIPPCVTDVVTGFYYLASLPLHSGNSYTFPVNDGGKTAEVTARVEGNERVKVPAGTFATIRVAAEATSGNLKGRGRIWAWFTDDGNHTPVQMRAKLSWGTLLFRLQRIDRH
jgi:Protein of unknown function (DUF3108)